MMKPKKNILVAVALLVSSLALFAEEVAEFRSWNTRTGEMLDAKLVKRESNTIFFEDLNGGEFKIAFAALSDEDQQVVVEADLPSLAEMNPTAKHMKISKLFGESLETASGMEVPAGVVEGKVILIYAAAKACEACVMVTSNLASYIEQVSPELQKKLQVVYAGVDANAEDQQEFLQANGLRWLAFPYGSQAKVQFVKRFKLASAPALLILRYDGTALEEKGLRLLERMKVEELEQMIERYAR